MKRAGYEGFIAGRLLLGGFLGAMVSPGVAQMPTEADVFVDRGILAYDSREYPEALRLSPTNLNALYYTGLTYLALEQVAPGQAALEQARSLARTDLDVAFQLGVVYVLQQQFDKAESLLREVYAAQPNRPNLGYYP